MSDHLSSNFDNNSRGIARLSTMLLAATGNSQATAALIQTNVAILQAGAAGLGVRLPDAEIASPLLNAAGADIVVINPTAFALVVYPNVANLVDNVPAGTINGGASISLPAGSQLEFFTNDGFTWDAGSSGSSPGGTTIIQASESDGDNIAAAGNSQANATPLTMQQSRITSGTPGGVIARAPVVNSIPDGVYNDSPATLTIYPNPGCAFYAQPAGGGAFVLLAPNASVTISPGVSIELVPFSSTVFRVKV